jgi:signal transduction histidine kinase
VPTWVAWEWMPIGLAPVLLAAAPLTLAGTVHVGLGWPRRRHRAPAVPVAYALAGLGAVLIAVAYNPLADPGCVATCARVDPLAGSVMTTRGAVTMTALLLAAGGLLAGWSLARDQRAPRLLRWSAGASLVLLVAGWGVHAWRWSDPAPAVAIVAPRVTASVLLAASVLATWWEIRRARLAAERLITELNDSAAVGASSLVAPTVEFAMPEDGRWIGPDGRPAPPRSDDGAVVLWQGGEPALRLAPDAGPSISSFDELSPGAMMALANARLAAVTRARLIEVRESRRRIGEASDAERRRIERDLHDGAQQRLISASLHVSLASSRLPGLVAERAQAAIRQALERLRQLAHGISSTPPEDP